MLPHCTGTLCSKIVHFSTPPPNQCWHLVAIEACIVAASKQCAFYWNSFWFKHICFCICVKRNNGFLETSDMGPHCPPSTLLTHTHKPNTGPTPPTTDIQSCHLYAFCTTSSLAYMVIDQRNWIVKLRVSSTSATSLSSKREKAQFATNQLDLSRAERACHGCTCNQFFEVQLTGDIFTPGSGNQWEIT